MLVSLARQHDGTVPGSGCELSWVRRLATARRSHACPRTPPLSAYPCAGAGGGGRSAAYDRGIAVVTARAIHEM
eukprot:5147841-Prymnesium_polylepis.1